ncbi:MAG: EAL domain-containing protein [Betaproteobacteria bacterium]|nr:EAL domain-containing protein [Betaproteobacteria bacterium]MCL2885782.1 EAL domain-containing protein [Betaproteobacteria bacterium]
MPTAQHALLPLIRNSCFALALRRPALGIGTLLLAGLLLLASCLAPGAARADDKAPLRIGILSYNKRDITDQRWEPLARYLDEQLPDQHFELHGLYFDDLAKAIEDDKLDFVLTNPQHYVQIRKLLRGFAPIATLAINHDGHAISRLGGVIIRRKDRDDIASLANLRGKRIVAANQNSAGGFSLEQLILLQAGINIQKEAATFIFTGQPLERVIEFVLQGKADAGFIRTGVIEEMVAEGKLTLDALRIVNQRHEPDFPLLLSTPLVPEWPFLANERLSQSTIKAVAHALLRITPNDPVAQSARFHSFLPPANYGPVETMMLKLRIHPEQLDYLGLSDIIDKYPHAVFSTLSALLLLTLAGTALLIRSRQQVGNTLRERSSLLDSLDEGIYGVDSKGLCTIINPKALKILGYQRDEIIGQDSHALFHHHRADGSDYPASECPIHLSLRDGQQRQREEYFFRRNGEAFPVTYTVTPIAGSQSRQRSVVVSFRDISEERRIDEMTRIAAIAFETQEGMMVTDADNRILRINQAFTQITGYTAKEAVGQTPALLKSGHHDAAFYQEMWGALQQQGLWRGEIWNRRKDGEIYPGWLNISVVRDEKGQTSHYIATFLDITQRKAAEKQIQFLAYYDPLTGLPNRSMLNECLLKALAACARHKRYGAVLFIDLDDFKTLNDTMGHLVGDQLLIQVAHRLQQSVRASDLVARLGGDEFVILLKDLNPNLRDAIPQIRHTAEHILAAIGKPYSLGGITYHATASIGAIPFRDNGESIENLLKSADVAMYKAKDGGKNALCFFDPAMQARIDQRMWLERELRQALDENQFVLYLQGQVDHDGKLLGAEALIRWQHPQRGLILPGEFIPAAESNRLILPIGEWVLRKACRQLARWQRHPATTELSLAVNVSAVQFRDEAFIDKLARVLGESNIRPALLKLEITESLLLDNIGDAVERMRILKEKLGVSLSLDDFGTGYSSLSYLQQLPLDQIKIDRSFITDIDSNPNDAAIVDAVIALGRAFNLTVIAEGVENAIQRDILLARGCHAFQGYLYGRPVTAEEFTRSISET